MINLAILVSGRGSNMESIIKSVKEGKINANVNIVISNKPNVRALSIAKDYGINTVVIDDENKKGVSWEYDKKIISVLNRYDITNANGLICLAGYMRILSPEFVRLYKYRIMNIHPSLLPAFPGLNAQKKALDYGVKITGCTVHFVDEGVDTGPIIVQKSVEVSDNDTVESLSARILKEEHIAYPYAIKLFTENRLRIEGRRVYII
jgi:phosphoribosylglycinamide formyltransferase-1